MCGIAGFFGKSEIAPERLDACLRAMKRRGPDGQGSYHRRTPSGGHVHLLHTRLSIIDLDPRAGQPMDRGAKTIAFNGEIYNYRELRDEMAANGAAFSTQSDTEVLLQLLAREGWRGLDKAEGMWAFALYDEKENTLLLSRDRFGEKPLYFFRDGSGVYFGSEVKFLFALMGRKLPVDQEHLRRYLVNGYKALYKKKHTFFQGLEELEPASASVVREDGSSTSERYWQPALGKERAMSYDDAVKGARQALIRSVELRLRSDVPLAFCMSGGIDSNSLISIAKRELGYDVHGFTIMNTDERYEEREMVEYAVRELGVRHTEVPVNTEDFLPQLRTLVRQHDAPVITITYYAHWQLMKEIARQGYKISISGTGADELFTGYYDHHNAYLYEAKREGAHYAEALANWNRYVRPIVRNPYLQNPDLFVEDPGQRAHIFLDADGFAGFLHRPWSEPFAEERYTGGLLRNRMLNEIFHETVPPILHEDDLNAMYYSIENRSPFLDRPLFEWCASVPTRHLVRNGWAKVILRDAMRGIVPERVLDSHRKVGFNAPIYSYLDVNDPRVRSMVLEDSPVFELIRREKIEELIEKPDLPNSQSKFLFYFLNTKIFLEEFA